MRIVYIDIDSLRPDHLGCYGYHRNTSPNADQLAREGVRFEQVLTPDAPCLPSRTAFYSGRFGIQTGVVGHGGSASQPKIEGPSRSFRDLFDTQGLARQLQKLGLHTAMISPFGQRHAAHWFYAGFHEVHNTGKGGMEIVDDIWPVADRWLQQNAGGDNWYLHVNLWDPHTPYRTPLEFGEPFKDEPLPKWLDSQELIDRDTKKVGPHSAMDIMMFDDKEHPKFPRHPGKITDIKSLRRMIDGYDTGVLYADTMIGKVIEKLKQAGVYDETAIIISGDHGENLGELGIYGEHGTADIPTCRVPLIIKWPGGKAGAVDGGLHYNLDLAPTLMELLGGESQPIWDGQSFASAITGAGDKGRDELVISQCAHVCQRSVRWNKWLYMRTYHDGFHLFPDEMLFDIQADPHEQHNLAVQHPDIRNEGARRLMNWHDGQMRKMAATATDVADPLWTVMREGGPFHANIDGGGQPGTDGFLAYLKRLEETGRAEGAAQLRKKYADRLKASASRV